MLSGFLVLNKDAGMTSQAAVTRVKRLFGAEKAGHTGTLDPMATGVLPIMIGRAVKAGEFLLAGDKHYRAGLLLGETSDTEDSSGTRLTTYAGEMPDEKKVRETVASFLGERMQMPPMYSALKVGGKKLCDLARQGIEIEREARRITVYAIETEKIDDRRYLLDVRCSKGTYIRTLCADIGRALGTGGVMSSLVRCEAAGFALSDAITLSELEEKNAGEREALLYSVDYIFRHDMRVTLPPFFARLARAGQPIRLDKIGARAALGTRVALYDGQGFFALGEVRLHDEHAAIKPIKQFDV